MQSYPTNFDGFRELARRKLPKPVFDFVDGGSDDEVTLRSNQAVFGDLRLIPRIFVDVSKRDLSTTVAGARLAIPIVFSPAGLVGLVHPDGETASAIVAKRWGTLAVVSGHGTYSLEEVAAEVSPPGWFNMFPWGERGTYGAYVDRAARAGYTGLCLTIDTLTAGNRERDISNGWVVPPRLGAQALEYARRPRWVVRTLRHRRGTLRNFDERKPSLATFVRRASASAQTTVGFLSQSMTWADLEWIRERWHGSLAVKGGFSVEDAKRMVDSGVDVLFVGNHGGRQLDGMQAALEQLPLMADAVGGVCDLVLDGGVRRGTDVVKALCLGAKAVSVGRCWVFGLACGGVAGVDASLAMLVRELDVALTLLGAPSVEDLDRSFLAHAGLPAHLDLDVDAGRELRPDGERAPSPGNHGRGLWMSANRRNSEGDR